MTTFADDLRKIVEEIPIKQALTRMREAIRQDEMREINTNSLFAELSNEFWKFGLTIAANNGLRYYEIPYKKGIYDDTFEPRLVEYFNKHGLVVEFIRKDDDPAYRLIW